MVEKCAKNLKAGVVVVRCGLALRGQGDAYGGGMGGWGGWGGTCGNIAKTLLSLYQTQYARRGGPLPPPSSQPQIVTPMAKGPVMRVSRLSPGPGERGAWGGHRPTPFESEEDHHCGSFFGLSYYLIRHVKRPAAPASLPPPHDALLVCGLIAGDRAPRWHMGGGQVELVAFPVKCFWVGFLTVLVHLGAFAIQCEQVKGVVPVPYPVAPTPPTSCSSSRTAL